MSAEEPRISTENVEPLPESPRRFPRMFSALRHHNFRLFWFGQMISLISTWMQSVAQGWLVLQMTNSAFLLGLVSMSASLPVLLFSAVGGVLADRFNKRNLIVATQTLAMTGAFILATLILTRHIAYWHIIIIASCLGIVMALDAPSRQSFVIEMVGKEDLLNAIALNSSIFNMARVVGPAVAGLIIAAVGVVLCFYLNGISFLAVIIGLLLMRGNFDPVQRGNESFIENLREGLAYARQDRRVTSFLTLIACSSIFIMPYAMLMPIFARDILKVGPTGLGTLLAAAGTGALIGALTLAWLGDFKKKGRLVFFGSISFTTAIVGFSFSSNYYLSLILLFFVGWGMVTQNASINSLLQCLVPDHLRGRIMSLFTLTFMGMMPVGSLLAGFIANYLGARMALRIGAFAVALVLCVTYVQKGEIFELKR